MNTKLKVMNGYGSHGSSKLTRRYRNSLHVTNKTQTTANRYHRSEMIKHFLKSCNQQMFVYFFCKFPLFVLYDRFVQLPNSLICSRHVPCVGINASRLNKKRRRNQDTPNCCAGIININFLSRKVSVILVATLHFIIKVIK